MTESASLRALIGLVEAAAADPASPSTAYPLPPEDPRNRPVLLDILSRADMAAVRAWVFANDPDEACWASEPCRLGECEYWLEQEHGIAIRNGMVEFWDLRDPETAHLIGDNPVVLYHFTSSLRLPTIRRHGLIGDRRSVNGRISEGVYLTTETSGPAVSGYLRNALRGSRTAYGVQLTVRTTLAALQPDPDDAEITSGMHQFVTDYVAPAQIIAADRV